MFGLVISSFFLPLILGQHDGYSKHKETRIFHQQHNESPKQTHLQYSSIGSYSGSSEDSQILSEDFSKNYIAQNGHGSKFPGIKTSDNNNRNDRFHKVSDLGNVQRLNNNPGPSNVIERQKINKFQEENGLDIRQISNNHPLPSNLAERQEINKYQQVNGLDVRQRINNYPVQNKPDQKSYKYQDMNNVGVRQTTKEFPVLRHFDERLQNDKFHNQNDFEVQRVNEVPATRNFDERHRRGETHQKKKNLEEFPRKDRFHGVSDFEEHPKNLRYQDDPSDQRRPGRHVSRPADTRQRRPRMSRNRGRENHAGDGRRSALPEIRRGQKVVKYIADKNGFAIREDLLKPLQDTIDRTQQESRRKVVMAIAGPQQGSRTAHVVTSAIRVTGQSGSGKFLPQIFDLKSGKRSKHLNVDRLAHAIGAREVVI